MKIITPEWISAIATALGVIVAIIGVAVAGAGIFMGKIKNSNSILPKEIEAVVQEILANRQGLPSTESITPEGIAAKKGEIAALTRAIEALRAPDSLDRKRRAEAEAALLRGDTLAADTLFAEIEKTAAVSEGAAQKRQAAAAARHRGAIAFLHDTRGALAYYQRATEHDPEDAEAWNRIGMLKSRLGDLAEAQVAYERALT
uniref:TPR repeat-containing protein n=1 Tax=Candidatus Kentrum sp. LFY TaxID=2126342 RepID=A0A450WLQ4_9GAMM|nr:MAG: TPR repeat-containing protein [Candidatus Kentron sp. LFY]